MTSNEIDADTRDWHMLDQLPAPGFVPDNLDPTTKIYKLYAEEYPVDMGTGDPLVGDFAQYRMYEVGERDEDGTIRYHDSEIDTEWTYTSREGSQHDSIQQEVVQWAGQLFGRPIAVQHNGAGDWELGLPPHPPEGNGPTNNVVQSAVMARFLLDGDRFEWDGKVLTADDNAVLDTSGELVVVPIDAGGDNAWVEIPAQQFVRLVDPGPDGNGDRERADSYDAEVDTLKQSFEFELCESCGGDLDAHAFVPDPLGHAHMLCTAEQDDELSPDAARWSSELLRPGWADGELTRVQAEATNLTSSITFAEASASSARDGVAEVEKFTASLTAASVCGEPLRLAGTAMELLGQLGTTLHDLAAELQRHTAVAAAYHSVGADAGGKQFHQAT